MRLLALAAGVALSAGALLASTTFANINYTGGPLTWGTACEAGCTSSGLFQYVGGMVNLPPYDGALHADLTYDWTPTGKAIQGSGPFSGFYFENLTGSFAFTYGATNLLTVNFESADAQLFYNASSGDLSLALNAGTTGPFAPFMTSDILTFQPLTDWAMIIDFGIYNPGIYTSGSNNGYIKDFSHSWSTFTVGSTPYPAGMVPEPASMLMAGAGLLSMGGLLSLRKRLRK